MNAREPADRWLRNYLTSTLTQHDLDLFLSGLEESFTTDIPELAADAELQRDLRAAVRSQLGAFLGASGQSADGSAEAPVSVEAHALARTVAQRGLELRVLSQLYHAGHRAMLSFATEFLQQEDLDAQFKLEVLTTMWSQTSELLNAMLDELAVTYADERERLLQGAFASRVTTVREILDGGGGVAQSSGLLGYPLRLTHTAVVAWVDDSTVFAGSLDRVMSRVAAGRRTLSVPSGAHGVWSWIAQDSDDPWVVDHCRIPDGVRLAVGERAPGIEGFRSSHREALAAQRIAEVGKQRKAVTSYTHVELVSMLSADPDAMRALVARELAGLLGEDAASERLRDTLRAVMNCHGNHEAAARRLGIHKNTVRYRMQRAEELLGGDILARRLKLELALECFEAFGG
ncbi:helix-turn-helix domain-containing protein [Rhodococcus hoagii]|uniref:PucR family transcriptional regulator n=1 Tax=Rhodococcus hoagii TaxID=43767 RepID=UPI00196452B1|nr:helix-turn-helix domain-containing protein [Prescottella equi]MBM9835479.1 helix-turn-helix domain-containing protein [Prescottella equi]NKR26203.1 Fis family transcriptional regulator [Prescottella equi]NKR60742.1 Fis family transcriptional regulator [Prescottella equi]NKS23348.1 Fis family transcriptional regulator [Prescottella equi]